MQLMNIILVGVICNYIMIICEYLEVVFFLWLQEVSQMIIRVVRFQVGQMRSCLSLGKRFFYWVDVVGVKFSLQELVWVQSLEDGGNLVMI